MSQIYIKNTETATILGKDKWPNMKLENDLNRQSQSRYVNGQKTQGNILNIAILARAL